MRGSDPREWRDDVTINNRTFLARIGGAAATLALGVAGLALALPANAATPTPAGSVAATDPETADDNGTTGADTETADDSGPTATDAETNDDAPASTSGR